MRFAGEFAALGTGICWACGSTLFFTAGQRMGSLTLNRLRITVAAVFLGTALLVLKGSPWPVWASARQIELLSLSGLIGFVFGDSFYFRSLVILGAGRATLLMSLAPIFTALLAWPILGETLGTSACIGIALTVGGLGCVLYGRSQAGHEHPEGSVLVGVISGVLAALGQAGGYVISKIALQSGLDPLSATVVRVMAAVVAVWLLAPAQGGLWRSFAALRDRVAAATMLGGAFFGPFLGVTLSLVALEFTKAGIAASITAIYPIFAILLAARFHRERITLRIVAGAAVAVSGVVVLFLH